MAQTVKPVNMRIIMLANYLILDPAFYGEPEPSCIIHSAENTGTIRLTKT